MSHEPEGTQSLRGGPGASRTGTYVWIGAALVGLALLSSLETYTLFRLQGRSVSLANAVAQSGVAWVVYGALSPLILWLAETFPPKGRAWKRHTLLHALLALLFGLGYAVVATASWRLKGASAASAPPGFGTQVMLWYLSSLPLTVLAYFAIHAVGRSLYWFSRHQEAESASALLRQEAVEARLAALRAQIHPHFLFNALNAVDTLIHEHETEAAGRILHHFSDLLREYMDEAHPAEVELGYEIALIRKYLEIQSIRFPGRLMVSFEVPVELERARVPAFVLQPLVENALCHGIAPHRGAGRLSIRAEEAGARLTLSVSDDGGGPPPHPVPGEGLGNLGRRLGLLYGDGASVELARSEWGGASARVSLPMSRGAPMAAVGPRSRRPGP